MKKAFLQLGFLVALFFGTWYALSKIDFVGMFRLREKQDLNERKLGDILLKVYITEADVIRDTAISAPLEKIKSIICTANGIDSASISVHIIDRNDVNAFALPNGHIVILRGLLADCRSAEEFSGVLAHEIAHVQKNHVMEKLTKEAGITILGVVLGGSGSGEIVRDLLKTLSSRAYDRKLEAEADKTAGEYLEKAGIDTEPFANFLYRMGSNQKLPTGMEWLTTHPESKERAATILKARKTELPHKTLLPVDWEKVREKAEKAGKDEPVL